jgi:hypothetical protein
MKAPPFTACEPEHLNKFWLAQKNFNGRTCISLSWRCANHPPARECIGSRADGLCRGFDWSTAYKEAVAHYITYNNPRLANGARRCIHVDEVTVPIVFFARQNEEE